MSYTKGKWEVKGLSSSWKVKSRAVIANLAYSGGDSDCIILAPVPTASVTPKQATANANLIAAAPELLEACIQSLDTIAKVGDGVKGGVYEMVVAAIAKAEGDYDK